LALAALLILVLPAFSLLHLVKKYNVALGHELTILLFHDVDLANESA
jgi:hypothetical protein